MKDLTFSEFAKFADIPRTTVYTRLNNIKKHDPSQYQQFVFQEDNTLKIYGDRVEELKQFIDTNHYEPFIQQLKEKQEVVESKEMKSVNESAVDMNQSLYATIDSLKDALERSEERYSRLFDDYLRLSATLQQVSDRLLQVTEEQQAILKEERRPQTWEEENQENIHRLAHVIQNMDEEPEETEDEVPSIQRDQRTRSEIRVESELDDNNKGLLGRLFK